MGCINALVLVLILILIAFSPSSKVDRLAREATDLFGSPTWKDESCMIWQHPEFKLCIANDTNLPVQLYFTWSKDIVRPRTDLYKILAKVCTDSVNYDIGSSKFTVKDVTLDGAFITMSNIASLY